MVKNLTFKEKRKREILLENLKKEIVSFKDSPLAEQRMKENLFCVVGDGEVTAEIMIVGEAPGRKESLTGKCFCGKAGEILNELISSINLKRENLYITNIVKDRPPKNRNPLQKEINSYFGFLKKEILIVQPKIIITMGRISSINLLTKLKEIEKPASLSLIKNNVFSPKLKYGKVKIIPMYHPASVIYDNKKKEELIYSFNRLKKIIEKESLIL